MLKDLLRYKANAVFVGGVVLALFLLMLAVAFAINRSFTLTFWDKGYEIKADFVDADGIANASDVRMSGVYVGQVTNIRSVQGGLAEITIRIDKAHAPLHEGSRANLRLQTLLGTKFIEVEPGPGNAKELANGSVLPSNATASPVDFDQLLSSFNKPTRDSISGLIQEAGTATDNRGSDINGLLGDLHSLSVNSTPDLETFADRSSHIDSILRNLDDVGGNLSDNRQHLANTFTNLNSVLGTIADNDAGLRRFIEQGNIGLSHGLTQFRGEEGNISGTFAQLRPALDKLNPELADVYRLSLHFQEFMKIAQPFTLDIFNANIQYNHNAANANCNNGAGATLNNAAGCGGFFLRQPTILAGNGCDPAAASTTCISENASTVTPAQGAAQTRAAAGPAPVSSAQGVLNLVPQGAPTSTPAPDNHAVDSLITYLLGH
jgi:virulence factor Mce-like protein